MVTIHVNPGTGPVSEINEEYAEIYAIQNIEQLLKEVHLGDIKSLRDPSADYGDGRFAYQLIYNQRVVEVQMPGLPLEKVRFLDKKGENVFEFPRLYVNGSSWLWKYAVSSVKDYLENPDQEQ